MEVNLQIAPYSRTCKPTPIADMVRALVAAGCSTEQIIIAIEGHELACPVDSPVDKVAQRRREYDRERKRIERNSGGHPPESADIANNILSKKDLRLVAKRLSADWTLPESCRVWSLSQGLTEQEIAGQSEVFRDYWTAKAGKDAAKTDWVATWRNWCRKFLEGKGRPINGTSNGNGKDDDARYGWKPGMRTSAEILADIEARNGKKTV